MQMPRDSVRHRSTDPHSLISYTNTLFCRTKMTFKDLGTEDVGIYSCDVTDTDGGISSSYLIDEEGKFKSSPVTSLMLL